jgi:hypothetical protein
MRRTADASADDLLAEQRSLAPLVNVTPIVDLSDYLGAADRLVDEALARARDWLEDPRHV